MCQIPDSSPPPICGCPSDYCGRRGMGDVFRQEFFSQISEVKIFFLTYNGVRFFFSIIYVMREIFSIAGYNFSQVYPCKLFPSKSVYMIFFFKSPITSSKVKLPSAKIHPNIDSVDRTRFVSHCQSLLKQ